MKDESLSVPAALFDDGEVMDQVQENWHRLRSQIGVTGRIVKAVTACQRDGGAYFLYGLREGLLHAGEAMRTGTGLLHDGQEFVCKRGVEEEIIRLRRLAFEFVKQIKHDGPILQPGSD